MKGGACGPRCSPGVASMTERWTLAQLVAWVTCRRAVPVEDWTDDLFPPRDAPATLESQFGPSVSAGAARTLAAQDDGVWSAIHAAALEVKKAAAEGRIVLHGKRVDSDPERAADAPLVRIPAEDFARNSMGLSLNDSSIGPAEKGEAPGATATAWDWHAAPRWMEVTVDARGAREVWPPVTDIDVWMLDYATKFVAEHGHPPKRDTAVKAAQAEEFPVDPSRRAYSVLPKGLRNPARKQTKRNRA